MTTPPKTMAEIRDAEAEQWDDNGDGYTYFCNERTAFKAGFDFRDKLGDEALKLAVEKLRQIAGEHEIYCCDDKTDCEWVAREALNKIRKLRGEL